MKKDNAAQFKAIRRELAEELGFDPDKLTALESMRVDVVFGLKSTLDEMRGRLYRGEQIDTGDMRAVADTLERYLPRHADPDPTPALYKRDPHQVMQEIVDRWRAADAQDRAERGLPPPPKDEAELRRRLDELERENVRLRGEPNTAHARLLPAPERVIDPPDGDIVGPSEQSDNPKNMRAPVGPDNHKLRPGSQIIDGKVVPVPPQARSGAETKAQMDRVNADRATMHRIMTEPSRVAHEPQPSSPSTRFGDPVIWPIRG